MLQRAIVRPPSTNFGEGLTAAQLGAPDYSTALEQHETYCAALKQCGLTLTRLEADPRFPDSAFVEDTAVVNACWAILARPGAPSRVGEVKEVRSVLAQSHSALDSIRDPGTLDGGDVCEAGGHFFIGISERTNETGAEQLAKLLQSFGYTASFVDIRGPSGILHLKSGVAYLGERRLVVIEALVNRTEFSSYDLVSVTAGEEYAANCVRVNNYVLVASGHPVFEAKLRKLGYQSIVIETGEFRKMDGGLSCLSLRF